ncbi:MAG: hypothetical protein A3A24_01760 [Candidatus Buchananbacteria bacterium RIFCSPLOWO2_01_FULL_46_12]|uniref:Peptidase M1 membrane alanine aminopeptidase domain-containing protein n=1 Tax=Candidatus Buchananbacteria bacterium RIFCSPLOWO2_01_FULL_46_12 TaxID=1797546 RepID=A0A1G1YRJ9_9BACT|nr:MAG: hypothetical protein A3A24_01760 [Candidatus Buchananbacteria bacterium RIFCSPLOWO2_01_FULL_46_12]
MKPIFAKNLLFCFCLSLLGNFLFTTPALAAIDLVKSAEFGTVYYLDSAGLRHPFPNQATYQSWYGNNFSKIVTVSSEFLAKYPLGKNITVRPGTALVKIRTSPEVYAVTTGAVLREIKDEDVAESIYGLNWHKRVIDIPDVFFGDYALGKVIDEKSDIPDGLLYQDQDTKKYYYKLNDLLQPFDSVKSVLTNQFKLTDAVVSDQTYLFAQRQRPITGLDQRIFNLLEKPTADNRDCENKKLKAAVIFLTAADYNADQLAVLEKIKSEVSPRFALATDKLSAIDLSYPTIIMTDDGYLTTRRNDGSREIQNELINTFYDQHPDAFDFLILWTNFKIPAENTNEIAHFTPIANRQKGGNVDPLNWSRSYGTTGKLKGIITMGDISKYKPETNAGLNEALNLVLHEILHQWSAYVSFIDSTGKQNFSLLRSPDFQHWSYYAGFVSPLGGSGWIDNADGTFTSQLSKMADTNLRQFSPLDLYLMGLIPYQLMPPFFYVKPDVAGAIGNTIAGQAQWVDVSQIIAAHGEVYCNPY